MKFNLAPVLLLSCMGLITTGLITILYQDNKGQINSNHREALQQQPPTQTLERELSQHKKLSSHTSYEIGKGAYAPLAYDPEVVDSSNAQSLYHQQERTEITRPAISMMQSPRDIYTTIPDKQQGYKMRYTTHSLLQDAHLNENMKSPSSTGTAMRRSQRNRKRSSLENHLRDSFNRPLGRAQTYAPKMESLPYSYTQPSAHIYEQPHQSYIPPRNISAMRDKRDTMWEEPRAYQSYQPSRRVNSYP